MWWPGLALWGTNVWKGSTVEVTTGRTKIAFLGSPECLDDGARAARETGPPLCSFLSLAHGICVVKLSGIVPERPSRLSRPPSL